MSTCDLTNKKPGFGNSVSHSQRKTRRKFMVNIQSKIFFSPLLQNKFKLSVSSLAIKSIDKSGGLDEYLLKASNKILSPRVKLLKKRVKEKLLSQNYSTHEKKHTPSI